MILVPAYVKLTPQEYYAFCCATNRGTAEWREGLVARETAAGIAYTVMTVEEFEKEYGVKLQLTVSMELPLPPPF